MFDNLIVHFKSFSPSSYRVFIIVHVQPVQTALWVFRIEIWWCAPLKCYTFITVYKNYHPNAHTQNPICSRKFGNSNALSNWIHFQNKILIIKYAFLSQNFNKYIIIDFDHSLSQLRSSTYFLRFRNNLNRRYFYIFNLKLEKEIFEKNQTLFMLDFFVWRVRTLVNCFQRHWTLNFI